MYVADSISTLKNREFPPFSTLDTVVMMWVPCPVPLYIRVDRKDGWSSIGFMDRIFPRIHRGGCAV